MLPPRTAAKADFLEVIDRIVAAHELSYALDVRNLTRRPANACRLAFLRDYEWRVTATPTLWMSVAVHVTCVCSHAGRYRRISASANRGRCGTASLGNAVYAARALLTFDSLSSVSVRQRPSFKRHRTAPALGRHAASYASSTGSLGVQQVWCTQCVSDRMIRRRQDHAGSGNHATNAPTALGDVAW